MTEPKVVHIRDYQRREGYKHIVRRSPAGNEKADRAFWKGGPDDLGPDDIVMRHADPEMVQDSGDCA